jgi:GT2 family glycosyltransferase
MTSDSAPYLSVIIPTYQRRDSVERALRALARQTLAVERYEVIVSIDGSEDGTRELLETCPVPYRLKHVWQPRRGRAAARNTGTRLAQGDILVFFDDDMEPAPECLEHHWHAHPNGSRLGAIGAAPVRCESGDPPVAAYIAAKFDEHLSNLARPNHRLVLRDFYSGHFSVRREVLFEVGLFDEAFRVYGNEDLELSVRLAAAGAKLVYLPEALAYQHYSKDFAALAHDTIAKGRTAVLLAGKHPEVSAGLQFNAYDQGSWRWRWVRAALLTLSRVWSPTPDASIAIVKRLEQWQVERLHLYYRFVLDYLYWLGVQTALRENRRTSQGLASLKQQV